MAYKIVIRVTYLNNKEISTGKPYHDVYTVDDVTKEIISNCEISSERNAYMESTMVEREDGATRVRAIFVTALNH